MSHSKIAFEQENPETVDAMRCEVCGVEATEDNKGRRPHEDVWLCNDHGYIADDPAFIERHYVEMGVIA